VLCCLCNCNMDRFIRFFSGCLFVLTTIYTLAHCTAQLAEGQTVTHGDHVKQDRDLLLCKG
jgi:hypothetical protein